MGSIQSGFIFLLAVAPIFLIAMKNYEMNSQSELEDQIDTLLERVTKMELELSTLKSHQQLKSEKQKNVNHVMLVNSISSGNPNSATTSPSKNVSQHSQRDAEKIEWAKAVTKTKTIGPVLNNTAAKEPFSPHRNDENSEPLFYMYELDEEFWWRWPVAGSDCSSNGYLGHDHAALSGIGLPVLLDDGLFLTWHFSLFSSLYNRLKRSRRRTRGALVTVTAGQCYNSIISSPRSGQGLPFHNSLRPWS